MKQAQSMRGTSRPILLATALVVVLGAALAFLLIQPQSTDLVLYCGVDQDQSQPMVTRFEEAEGLKVEYHGESEAFRSVGLPKRLLREKDNPIADVYWSNEIMHMIDLVEAGVIDPLPEGLAERFPPEWRDPRGRFVQFGARARIILVNEDMLPDRSEHPTRVRDLIDPRWAERGMLPVMAAPLTGTTYTHAVAWFTRDEADARAFYEDAATAMNEGRLKVVSSNGQVMSAVRDSTNKIAFGLTDTDDAYIAIQAMAEGGAKVRVIYPDQGEGEVGTLLIPNTAGVVKGTKRKEAATTFLKWLTSEGVARELAAGLSAQIPVRAEIQGLPEHVKRPPDDFRATPVDWYAVGQNVNRWHDMLTAWYRAAK